MTPNEPSAEGTTVGRKTPNARMRTFRPPDEGTPPSAPVASKAFTGQRKNAMKKTTTHTHAVKRPPEEGGPAEIDVYLAPRPPSKGRIVSLDCHPDTFTASVWRGTTPHEARKLEERLDMGRAGMLEWLSEHFGKGDIVLMEAGSNSFELARILRARGLEVAVLESRHVGKFAQDHSDNDRMATERIAMAFLAGNAPCVWVPDEATTERRNLLHAQQKAARDHVRALNTFKSFLNTEGVRLGKRNPESPKTLEWVMKRRDWSARQARMIEIHWEELVHQARRRAKLVRMIHEEVCSEPLMLRVMQLLGIGPINAFAVLAVVGDVRRFSHPSKLVAYLGLNPGRKLSGKSKLVKIGIGGRGRGDLRSLLTQSAQVIMRRGKQTAIGAWGWKVFLAKGNRNVAVGAVARKLVMQIWHLLSGDPPTALEPDKRYRSKLTKLLQTLGSKLRAEIGLPRKIAQCIEILMIRVTQREPQKCHP
jgi:transposase